MNSLRSWYFEKVSEKSEKLKLKEKSGNRDLCLDVVSTTVKSTHWCNVSRSSVVLSQAATVCYRMRIGNRTKLTNGTIFNDLELSWVTKGVFIATQLNWTQLTQLNNVQPSQSCFCLWRHDLQTESTVVHAVELSSVELCRYKRAFSDIFSDTIIERSLCDSWASCITGQNLTGLSAAIAQPLVCTWTNSLVSFWSS